MYNIIKSFQKITMLITLIILYNTWKYFLTGSSGFIGFHLSKKLLDKGNKVHGFDSMNSYYDIKLKKARYKILNKYKKFSFTKR